MRSLTILLCLGTAAPALAAEELQAQQTQEPEEVLVAANTAYGDGEYGRAAQLYEQLIDSGADNGHLYYNLGNAYLRAGRVGRAIAAYRIGQHHMPRNQDLAANLAFARSLTKDALAPAEASPVLRTLFAWHYGTSMRELLTAMLVVNLLFWCTLAALLFRRKSEILRWAAVGLLLVLLAVGASASVRVVAPQRIAVVQAPEIEVRSGTSRDTVVRFKLHEGAEATVLDSGGGWARIALPNGEQGWVERENVELIVL
jgi:tetratricopeptide (TPR) repeat protein